MKKTTTIILIFSILCISLVAVPRSQALNENQENQLLEDYQDLKQNFKDLADNYQDLKENIENNYVLKSEINERSNSIKDNLFIQLSNIVKSKLSSFDKKYNDELNNKIGKLREYLNKKSENLTDKTKSLQKIVDNFDNRLIQLNNDYETTESFVRNQLHPRLKDEEAENAATISMMFTLLGIVGVLGAAISFAWRNGLLKKAIGRIRGDTKDIETEIWCALDRLDHMYEENYPQHRIAGGKREIEKLKEQYPKKFDDVLNDKDMKALEKQTVADIAEEKEEKEKESDEEEKETKFSLGPSGFRDE